MVKIKVESRKEVAHEFEVDVEFPIYIKYDGTGNDGWRDYRVITRVQHTGDYLEVKILEGLHDNKPSFEIDAGKMSIKNLGTYLDNKCHDHTITNEKEFNEIVDQILERLGVKTYSSGG